MPPDDAPPRLALAQVRPISCDPAATLAQADRLARQAAGAGAAMLVLPEMYLTGYNIGAERVAAQAEPAAGASAQAMARIAAEAGIDILYGFPERDGDAVYNSCALVAADGGQTRLYRKTHLFGAEEASWFRPGDACPVAPWRGLHLGLLICYDVEFAEVVRGQALAGAELICVPTANMMPYTLVPEISVRARALENAVTVAYANWVGEENGMVFTGQSVVYGPDGGVIAQAGNAHPQLLLADLPAPGAGAGLSTQARDRRPDLYRALAP